MKNDELLALGVQKGQRADLIQLVERHYGAVKGYLYRITGGNLMLCEDMAQETFLRMLRSIQTYQYPRPFKPWLYAIATNLVRSEYVRAENKQTIGLDEEDWSALHDRSATLEDNLITSSDTQEAVRHLNNLPQPQREVLILRYFEGLSLLEIAEALHIPEGTVKSRLSLALKRLRESMKGHR